MISSLFAGAAALALLGPASAPADPPDVRALRRAELLRQEAAIQAQLDALDAPSAPVAVPPRSARAPGAPTAATVVVTAAAPPLTQHPAGQAVAEVGRDLFKDQADINIAEVLDLVPGVSVVQGNGPRDVSISVRGSNDRQTYGVRNVQVFEDGFPVTQPDGLARTDLTDPHAYRAIEVEEGPSSALYGNYATGGAIEFHTRTGGDIDGLEAGADFGSFGTYNDWATFGAKGERYDASAFVSNVRGDGATSNSRYDTVTENALLTYALTPSDRITFKFINNDLDTALSLRLSLNQYRLNPLQQGCGALAAAGCASVSLFDNGFNGAKANESAEAAGLGRHDRRTVVGARYEHDLDPQTTWRTTMTFDNRDISQPTGSTSYKGTYPSFNLISDVTRHASLFGLGSTSLLGVYGNYEDINSQVYNLTPAGDATLGGEVQAVTGHQLNLGVRAREELALTPRLLAVLAGAVEYTELGADEMNLGYPVGAASPSLQRIDAHRTFLNGAPEVSLQWRPEDSWTLHARFAEGYGTPQATNLFTTPAGTFGDNTQLKTQTNRGVDLGAEWRPSPTARLFVSGFYEWFSDELVTQSAGVNLQSYSYNAPASVHRGVEAGLDWRPLPAVLPGGRLYVSYTYDDQRYTRYVEQLSSSTATELFDRAGQRIPGVTPQFGEVRAIYDQPDGALAGLGGFVEGVARASIPLDNANLIHAPGSVLLNGELHYDPPAGVLSRARFYLEVENLLGQTTIASASNITDSLGAGGAENGAAVLANSTGAVYAGAPRSVYGGVRVRFGGGL